MAKINGIKNMSGAEISAELQKGGKDVTERVLAAMKQAAAK